MCIRDSFLGSRDCQAYVEPCEFGTGTGELDDAGELSFGLMFHGFDYPDETGEKKLQARFCHQKMVNGAIRFDMPEDCTVRKFVREMSIKHFGIGGSQRSIYDEAAELEGVE